MSYINPRVLDEGLTVLDTEATRLDICDTEPSDYTEATDTYSLGNKTSLSIGSPADRSPSGRQVTVAQITDGTIDADGTAAFYAISDTANSRLLAVGDLSSSQAVTTGNQFNLAAFNIGMPGPA
ncbi:hypothetical protein ACFOGJ_08910 [Marinibaculum pumilum]|uniref:Head decoration protein n=1 Tax=Marinibaculum pumilum TaxID=1766165 RepID=A0ABV7KYC9_9PROT